MLTGTIKSYSNEKKYGFIQSEHGESYFFHFNDLNDKTSAPKAGQIVSFDDVPTPKGMAAKKIYLAQGLEKIYLPTEKGKFFINRSNSFGDNYEVVFKGPPLYSESRDPDEAYNYMITQAKVYGFNSLLHVQRTRRTGSEISNRGNFGGHKFTIHCYKSTPALIQKVSYTSNSQKILDSERALESRIESLKEAKLKDLHRGPSLSGIFYFVWIVFIISIVYTILSGR
ncbi:MAG: cold shock domain-containing protein [Halomonas sp.]|nr:cold shock domain-containing protein [Halomonas sp.]MBR2512769.1 cold shock domain-containing protein [Halomonas sp.]